MHRCPDDQIGPDGRHEEVLQVMAITSEQTNGARPDKCDAEEAASRFTLQEGKVHG